MESVESRAWRGGMQGEVQPKGGSVLGEGNQWGCLRKCKSKDGQKKNNNRDEKKNEEYKRAKGEP